jgi:hypothetical protein
MDGGETGVRGGALKGKMKGPEESWWLLGGKGNSRDDNDEN